MDVLLHHPALLLVAGVGGMQTRVARISFFGERHQPCWVRALVP
jgi:hypothetical protein